MIRFLHVLAGLSIALAAARAEPLRLTLEDCLRLGEERSVALASAQRERLIAEEDIRRIRAQVHPSLDASGSYTRLGEDIAYFGLEGANASRNQYRAALNAEQLLYSGGSVRAALRAAESYRIRADEEINRTIAALRRDITKAFYTALYHEAAVDVGQASVAQLEEVEREARMKFESGVLSELEWLSAQVRLANERPVLIAAKNERDNARSALRNLLYLDDDAWALDDAGEALEEDARPIPAEALSALQELGRANRWELRQAEVFLDILEADIRVTTGEFLPEVKAFASYAGADPSDYNPIEDEWDWQWVAGIRIQWKLFDGGARRAIRAEKQLKKEIAADAITDLERGIDVEIETAFRRMRQALQVLEGSRETIRLAEKALAIARLRYDRGLGTNLEFTDRNLERNRAHLQHLAGRLAFQHAVADLTYACGVLETPEPRKLP
ncbi:MAG TPA: TolC family protein [Kiritimatiellia bacterium]|nr:TolC family protein [Kiritimatiellia bacterium]HMO98187.1 TolC family protein [Kiritimatiellia bacterium]HMP97476.1 TolC family protein [Kiritimatiellia bacterium]